MKKTMVKCDNPECSSVGIPEHKHKKGYTPPYGWILVSAYWIGCGPNVRVEVCNIDCMTPAVREAVIRSEAG